MAKAFKLNVVRFGEKPGLCGAACAQMILNEQQKVGKTKAVQDQLWNEIKANTVPSGSPSATAFSPCDRFPNQIWEPCRPEPLAWCTYPTALSVTINNHLGGSVVHVVTDGDKTGLGITARAITSVMGGVAPAVLVNKGSHWVVVYGYFPDGAGPPPGGSGQPITKVYVHDPEWLSTQTMWTIDDWTNYYLDPPVKCGFYGGRQVMVGVGGGPPHIGGIMQPLGGGGSGGPIIEVLQILEQAKGDAQVLAKTDEWSVALRNAQPRTPMLVTDLTQSGRDYYLVDFRTADRPTARMVFNARTGSGGSVTGIEQPGEYLPDFLLPGDVLRAVDGRIAVPAASLTVDPTLVWKACDQSHTPFQPFYALRQGDYVVYVRVDGEIFTELTSSGAGGSLCQDKCKFIWRNRCEIHSGKHLPRVRSRSRVSRVPPARRRRPRLGRHRPPPRPVAPSPRRPTSPFRSKSPSTAPPPKCGSASASTAISPNGCGSPPGAPSPPARTANLARCDSVAGEVLVAKTELSYSYTQTVRNGRPYNLYHGTLEARPLTPTTSKMVYTLFFDNSMLADDAARERDRAQKTTQFMTGLENMKILAEGGTLPPAPPAPARGGRRSAGRRRTGPAATNTCNATF